MSHLRSLSVVTGVLVAALVGCGGGDDDGDAQPTTTRAEPTTTTAAPATIDLSQPIPGGSLHGTPRPPLENTGDDYVAIFESLMASFRWLTENPDVAVISELFVPGTPGHDARVDAYQFLIENSYRWADEGYLLLSVDVVDVQAGLVSLIVLQQLDFERLVDSEGVQVGSIRAHSGPQTVNFLLGSDPSGRWRVADATRVDEAEVDV